MAEKKKRSLSEDSNTCSECGGHIVTDDDAGERHCEDCGLVSDFAMIDYGVEYRVFDEEDKAKQRVGPPSTENMHDRGQSTVIGDANRDSRGNTLSPEARRAAQRLVRLHNKSRTRANNSQDRNLIVALFEINRKSAQMQISNDVREETAHIYRRAAKENIIRGRSVMSVIAASFYLACRICRHPVSIDEIAHNMGISRKECGRVYRFMCRRFRLRPPPAVNENFLEKICQEMKLPPEVLRKAREYMKACEDAEIFLGKAPGGLVAAVIYEAAGGPNGNVTQTAVSEKCNVTEVTLRNRCKLLKEVLQGMAKKT